MFFWNLLLKKFNLVFGLITESTIYVSTLYVICYKLYVICYMLYVQTTRKTTLPMAGLPYNL